MPTYICSVFGCSSCSGIKFRSKGITFHRFPKDVALKNAWVKALRRIDIYGKLWQPGDHSAVCSFHFKDSDFYWEYGHKLVKDGIIPTVFFLSSKTVKKYRKPPKNQTNNNRGEMMPNFEMDTIVSEESNSNFKEALIFVALQKDHNYSLPDANQIKNKIYSLIKQIETQNTKLKTMKKNHKRAQTKISRTIEKLKEKQKFKINNIRSKLRDSYFQRTISSINLYTNHHMRQKKFVTTLYPFKAT